MKKTVIGSAILFILCFITAACGSGNSAPASTGTTQPEAVPPTATAAADAAASVTPASGLTKVKQVVGWFPQPEHGGQFAALKKGFYEEAGLDMTIEPGGPQISPVQIVASGQADFSMATGDNLVLARSQGIPVVAIAAIFQKSPLSLLTHADNPISNFSELNGRKVFVAPGYAYWDYIKNKYHLDNVQEMSYTGDLSQFSSDPTAVTQGYATNEPYSLGQQGIETNYTLASDSGYMPYDNVLFTTEQFIKDHPDIVKAYVEASVKGWNYYREHYEEINPYIMELNDSYTLESLKFGAEQEEELVFGGDAEAGGFGTMTKERWQTLTDQMVEMGVIEKAINVDDLFTTEFLPGKQTP